jgi:hypothetical protein
MKENFDQAFVLLCELEGYKSEVMTREEGFRTIWGISEKWYPEEVAAMLPMTKETSKGYARAFYKEKFWDELHLDTVAYPLDMVAFCQSVNMPAEVKKFMAMTHDWRELLFLCQDYYYLLAGKKPDLGKFFRGWINRTLILWTRYREVA